jgi:uncharacterized protein (TIGR02996 family)
VTEEAFIRAVVDHPGQDTPRLVYADWLDDHGAPDRAAYLRAEAEWAAPWRTGVRPAEPTDLRRAAAGLDPLWVARVSRPPGGVCCDHIHFVEPGPALTGADLDAVEVGLGGRLPTEFRAFLLTSNGSRPMPPWLPYPPVGGVTDLDLEIDRFYSATPIDPARADSEIEQRRAELEDLHEAGGHVHPNPLLVGLVPIARTAHDLGYLLIGVRTDNAGRVYHFRDYCHATDDPSHLVEYAASFPEFLTFLREEQAV